MKKKLAEQITFRLLEEDELRVQRIAPRHSVSRYELNRRLFLLGLSQVEQGADLSNSGSLNRFEELLRAILAGQESARARDFNLASDSLENRTWLRTLGELLAPEAAPKISHRVANILERFLATHEQLPEQAPPPKS